MNTIVRPSETAREVVLRFAGDSGDGMQLTGGQFTTTSALIGNDIATFPDFPAEIRAPAGTLPGVSGFQVRFSAYDITSPGDAPDVLVAMNPAALKVNYKDVKPGGIIIVNVGNFGAGDLKKAGYEQSPLETAELARWQVVQVDLNKLTIEAVKDLGLDPKASLRCKNFFALGMTYWLFSRPLEPTLKWITDKFKKDEKVAEANRRVLKAGWNYAETVELFHARYEVPSAHLPKGRYRNIMGNEALALGLVAGAKLSGLKLVLGSYPITPASDILHQLAAYKNYGVVTFQAEDEIAAIGAAIGAAYAGELGVTTTSGPGVALKSEAINLAIMTELPLVIVDVQRGGPSTGLPTKTEQADLLQAMYGRNGESPLPIVACSSPADCFDAALEACRLAVKYMTPVMLLSDGYVANGSEPWLLPKIDALKPFPATFATDPAGFMPYRRDETTLARPWAKPGTPGLEHRIGGLEKQDVTGAVNYEPGNHERMVKLRAAKVAGIADALPLAEPSGAPSGKVLVLSWGGTAGSVHAAMARIDAKALGVGWVHLRHLNPFPKNLGDLLKRYDRVLVPELNLGQLSRLVSGEFGIPTIRFNKVQGRPFTTTEVADRIVRCVEEGK
ncbi:MAG TPA: 2-oxoacid:acceptor oxidoreductase subunit alpha [Planctomycetota bacterium]|nr:2-oxoacid:acceptor oxidoreductase subunit alpha [Planctomycetota bacterium]